MPNHVSSEKHMRQTVKRTAVNRSRIAQMRTAVKNAETAIAGSDKKAALAALRIAEQVVGRTVQKGALKKETASRKISRLAKRAAGMK